MLARLFPLTSSIWCINLGKEGRSRVYKDLPDFLQASVARLCIDICIFSYPSIVQHWQRSQFGECCPISPLNSMVHTHESRWEHICVRQHFSQGVGLVAGWSVLTTGGFEHTHSVVCVINYRQDMWHFPDLSMDLFYKKVIRGLFLIIAQQQRKTLSLAPAWTVFYTGCLDCMFPHELCTRPLLQHHCNPAN